MINMTEGEYLKEDPLLITIEIKRKYGWLNDVVVEKHVTITRGNKKFEFTTEEKQDEIYKLDEKEKLEKIYDALRLRKRTGLKSVKQELLKQAINDLINIAYDDLDLHSF